MCRVVSCVVEKWRLLLPSCSLDKTLLAFTLLHFVSQGQTCQLVWVSLDFLLLHSNPLWWKGAIYIYIYIYIYTHTYIHTHTHAHTHIHLVLVLEGLVWIIESFHFSLFVISIWGIDLDYCDVEWFSLETNQDHSIVFEMAPKYWIADSLVEYEGYSISSMGFLPIVIDMCVCVSHSVMSDSLQPHKL